MKYLGIDLGTTFTKAAVFDTETEKYNLVELNTSQVDFGFGKTKYAMPTAVLVNDSRYNRSYEVGISALNMKAYPGTLFFENFKPSLDYQEDNICSSPTISYIEILTAIFSHVNKSVKGQFSLDIDRIVLTVPASTVKEGIRWNRMLEAAKTAFQTEAPIDIIYEPEAAGFALLNKTLKTDKTINDKSFLIYDFGGGTFDTSVFKVVDEQIFIVGESVGSDEQMKWGGIYIDDLLRKDYIKNGEEIQRRISLVKSSTNLRMRLETEELLRIEPVKAKIAMSSKEKYDYFLGDYCLSKDNFECIVHPMIEETILYSQQLVESKEEEGEPVLMKDIKNIYLVGGSSKIPLISSLWKERKTLGNYNFEIKDSDIETVAVGAAMYNHVRVIPERLVELGIIQLDESNYDKAALYFRNADSSDGYCYLGILYYEGLVGNKRNYSKAVQCFKLSDNEMANMMLARCAFQGRQGLPRNHSLAKEYIKRAGCSCMSKKLKEALSTTSPSTSILNEIYDYDPVKDVLSTYDIKVLKEKYIEKENSSDRIFDESDSYTEDGKVKPVDPELDYFRLMDLANMNY